MPKGDREFVLKKAMTKEEIQEHNQNILKKFGLHPYLIDYDYIPKTVNGYLKEKVFRRDRFICQQCGVNGLDDLSVKFHVHHVIPVKSNGINHLINLTTLCEPCHRRLNNG